MKKSIVMALAGGIAFCSWTILQKSPINKAEWLIGTWVNRTPKGNIYEAWTRKNDGELFGKSYMLEKNDTILFETIRLVGEGDSLFYIPAVKDQNNGRPVRFAMKVISDTKLVFENPKHDFPQIISYNRINADSLVAEISGIIQGKERRQMFPMKKIRPM